MGIHLNLDKIAWTYISIALVWNLAIVAALAFLWTHRSLPSLRMRRLPLLFPGILCLHTYGCFVLFLYMMGPGFPCSAEFWIMSIYLPLGIALFHASNSQFLYLASRQKHFAHGSMKEEDFFSDVKTHAVSEKKPWKRLVAVVGRTGDADQTLIYIGIGLVVQFTLTLFVFLGSRKFHSFGFFDYTVMGTGAEQRQNCSKGWEWWLSIIWQFWWSWIYAPYCLWKSRAINDVHHWRLQTICCCIAGLPASPLWLAALYAPGFASVNAVIPPPVWFAMCIFMMEICAVGFPIADVLKGISLRQETLEAIANWEARQASNGIYANTTQGSFTTPTTSTATTLKSNSRLSTITTSCGSQKSDMLTMKALENALRTNPAPLLQFASMKDFSGENVSFLTNVADWRHSWLSPKMSVAQQQHDQFIAATRIYACYVSELAEFPINISSREMKRLQNVFEDAANLLYRHKRGPITSSNSDNATPFDSVLPNESKNSFSSTTELKSSVNLDALGRANFRAVTDVQHQCTDEMLAEIEIHTDFEETIWDAAENEIKYLVLTNTWPKFVNCGHACSQMSKDTDEETANAWVKRFWQSL